MARQERKIPHLEPAIETETKNGEYVIKMPSKVPGTMDFTGKKSVDVVRLHCHSLITHSPDTIVKCNSCVKTIVCGGTGDQTEIIECGKCRTSYLVRTRFAKQGKPEVDCAIWDISRNVKNYCFATTNDAGDFIVRFNSKKSPRNTNIK